jgi:putative acyl-CoA dehydrogenase
LRIRPNAVFNQPPPLEDYNLFDSDCALREAVNREGGGWINAEAHKLGQVLGKPETINLGVLANRFAPELRTHDRFGYRIDEVVYHPHLRFVSRMRLIVQR